MNKNILLVLFTVITTLLLSACSDSSDREKVPPVVLPDTVAPQITAIADASIDADSSDNNISVSVSDDVSASANIDLVAMSSDQNLVSDVQLNFSGDTLVIVPEADSTGSVEITVQATDEAGNSSSTSFNLDIVAVDVELTELVRTIFAQPGASEPVPVNAKNIMTDGVDSTAFDDLLQN